MVGLFVVVVGASKKAFHRHSLFSEKSDVPNVRNLEGGGGGGGELSGTLLKFVHMYSVLVRQFSGTCPCVIGLKFCVNFLRTDLAMDTASWRSNSSSESRICVVCSSWSVLALFIEMSPVSIVGRLWRC